MDYNSAFCIAQDLLQEWVRDKMDFNDMEFSEEPWSKPKSQLDVKKEWDRLVEANADPCLDYLQANINGSGDHGKNPCTRCNNCCYQWFDIK